MRYKRREFLGSLAAPLVVGALAQEAFGGQRPGSVLISCNQYAWITFFGREKRDWNADLDASLAEYVQSGLKAFEPSFTSVEEVNRLAPLLQKYQLAMPSAYVGSVLHDPQQAPKSIQTAIAIAEAAKPLGLRILVSNPSPLKWGPDAPLKTDEQLIEQAKNLTLLGRELHKRGVKIAYHTHDVELRAGARELHHMLQNTDPTYVGFCLDTHWAYRGAENSQVALFDILKMYRNRLVELHLRQSIGGVWSETFGPGDIDYPRLAAELKKWKKKPLLVLEQCLEGPSPNTTNAIEAHRRNLDYIKQVFV